MSDIIRRVRIKRRVAPQSQREHVMRALNRDDAPAASGGQGRRLQGEIPWGINMVNMTHLWDVS